MKAAVTSLLKVIILIHVNKNLDNLIFEKVISLFLISY